MHLRQGKKITKLDRLHDAATLWKQVVDQLNDQDLGQATGVDPPSLRDVELHPQHAAPGAHDATSGSSGAKVTVSRLRGFPAYAPSA